MFEIQLIICLKMDLALNNLQRLICHKTQTTNQLTRLVVWLQLFLSVCKLFELDVYQLVVLRIVIEAVFVY